MQDKAGRGSGHNHTSSRMGCNKNPMAPGIYHNITSPSAPAQCVCEFHIIKIAAEGVLAVELKIAPVSHAHCMGVLI